MISEGHLINGSFSLLTLMHMIGGANELEGVSGSGLIAGDTGDESEHHILLVMKTLLVQEQKGQRKENG